MKQSFFTIALFFLILCGSAQIGPYKYFVKFTDKNGTPYSIYNPSAFLSQRAIQRRTNQAIQITQEDLPVNPSYVTQVANIGVTVLTRSKWFNGITIYTMDSTKLQLISALPFVTSILKNIPAEGASPVPDKFQMETSFLSPIPTNNFIKASPTGYDYGPSYRQIGMLHGDVLHDLGYRGQGKVIAILDAGFQSVDNLYAFDSLWQNNQILGTKDFVDQGGNVFIGHVHGMMVLSLIGGNVPGQLIGTAPKASFWLLRSEDANTEYLIEEYNWVSAAEFADSVGADIISSSLGYTTFTDPSMNHTCADMDGHTTPAAKGANIAALKGMVVVVSAGNEGGTSWTCVSTPSDGDNVLSIAAVDSNGVRAGFSSMGVDTNGRVKPNIASMGENDVVYWVDNTIVRSSGTSFSCPIIAGMMACLWQAHPGSTPAEIYQAVEESSSQYAAPNDSLGYGIPDYSVAMVTLSTPVKTVSAIQVYPNPFVNEFLIRFHCAKAQKAEYILYDGMGRMVDRKNSIDCRIGENRIHSDHLESLAKGLYLLKLTGENFSESYRLIKKGF